MRQLRNTRRLKSWLRRGETVELRERERVIGRIVPSGKSRVPAQPPDFAARRRKLFGRRRVAGAKTVAGERGRY